MERLELLGLIVLGIFALSGLIADIIIVWVLRRIFTRGDTLEIGYSPKDQSLDVEQKG